MAFEDITEKISNCFYTINPTRIQPRVHDPLPPCLFGIPRQSFPISSYIAHVGLCLIELDSDAAHKSRSCLWQSNVYLFANLGTKFS